MTKDDIIRMAVECQLLTTGNRVGIYADSLCEFAKLVAAVERQACANLAFDLAPSDESACDISVSIRARGQA
jgi:hypothetical protein